MDYFVSVFGERLFGLLVAQLRPLLDLIVLLHKHTVKGH